MKSRETKDMLQAFGSIYVKLEEKCHKLTLHVLDNACSRAVKQFLCKKDTDTHIVETHNYTVLAAEPAIKSPSITQLPIWQPSTRIAQFNFGAN